MAQQSPAADPEMEKAAHGPADAYLTGVRLLGLRSHSIAELTRKLRRRGHSEEDAAAAVARLVDQRYLNDAEFARALVNRRTASRGSAAIAAELKARGISRTGIDEALGEAALRPGRAEQDSAGVDAGAGEVESRLDRELAGAERYARTWAAKAGLNEVADLRSLLEIAGPRLLRRGYAPAVVREACRRAIAGARVLD